jgi:hypothetical protein
MHSFYTDKSKELNDTDRKIILVDTYTDLNYIKNKINSENIKIITFDYQSHQKLKNEKIDHELSDNYITDLECKSLQNYVYKFSYWFLENNFSHSLEHREINICSLYQDELINYFVRFLKKFKELENIFNKNKEKEFLAQNELFNIINYFSPSSSKNLTKSKNNPDISTPEQIRISFKIFGHQKNLFLSKSLYQQLKNLQDLLINNFFKPRILDNTKTNVLFVEYNTERFKDLFLKSKEFNTQIFFYGPKRPPFWNITTFKTILNSKCKIITNRFLNQSSTSENNEDHTNEMSLKISKLWEKNELLEQFFTFENFNIFNLIKPKLVELIENRLSFTIHEIELANSMLKKFKFDYSVVINESGFYERIISCLSNTHQIKCIHMQEGFHWDTEDSIENISSQGVFLHDAKKLAVWGDIDRTLSIKSGNTSTSNIKVIGAPRYDNLFNSKTENSDYILLASSGDPQPEEIEGLRTEKIEKYLNDVLQISKIVSDLNEKLLIKLHPSSTQLMNIIDLAPKISQKISVIPSGEIIPLLSSAKLLICIGLSSALIEAIILKKPVILLLGMDYNWGTPSIINDNGCLVSNIHNLKNDLKKILYDKNFCDEQHVLSQKYLSKLISYHGNASDNFYEYLKNYT